MLQLHTDDLMDHPILHPPKDLQIYGTISHNCFIKNPTFPWLNHWSVVPPFWSALRQRRSLFWVDHPSLQAQFIAMGLKHTQVLRPGSWQSSVLPPTTPRVHILAVLEARSGLEAVLDAIAHLRKKERAGCTFHLIGPTADPMYASRLRVQATSIPVSIEVRQWNREDWTAASHLIFPPNSPVWAIDQSSALGRVTLTASNNELQPDLTDRIRSSLVTPATTQKSHCDNHQNYWMRITQIFEKLSHNN